MLMALSVLVLIVLKDLPKIDDVKALIFQESTVLLDSTGQTELYSVHGDQNRKMMPINGISPHMVNAIIAAEDAEFFTHPGFDIGGIAMAFCHEFFGEMKGLCPQRGGSTLTQQIIKNFLLTPERTYTRKFKEIILAYQLERRYSKEQILEIYLNGVSFGSNLYGVETASLAYFNKSSGELTPAEASVLAALPQAPSRYSPFGENAYSSVLIAPEAIAENNLETFEAVDAFADSSWNFGLVGREIELANGKKAYFEGRADGTILKRMRDLGFITPTEFEQAKQDLIKLTFPEYRVSLTAPHFVLWVKEELEGRFGKEMVEHGGLRITTSLDLELQKKAEEIVAAQVAKNGKNYKAENAALVALEPSNALVRAMVGSADYWNDEIDGKVNIIVKKRLPGSSFKPITYAAAFLQGKLSPASVLFDVETDFGNDWVPKNFDGRFSGPVSIRRALGTSLNIPAIKAAVIAGPDNVYKTAESLGVSFDKPSDFYGAAIAIGGAEASPLDMAEAFASFIDTGKKKQASGVLKVEDRFGNLLYSADQHENDEQAIDAAVAYQVTDMLADADARGSGWNSYLQLDGRKNMVKTGTADKKVKDVAWPSDCWTIGGTPQLLTAVWTGNNDGSVMAKNASGFEIAAPIWKQFMTAAHAGKPAENFTVPSDIKRIQVSKLSGLLPAAGTPSSLITEEVFAPVNTPTKTDESIRFLEIDSVSGKLPNEYTPKETIKRVAILNMRSYYPDLPSWERPVQNWLAGNKGGLLARYGLAEDEILVNLPEGTDDMHTADTARRKPELRFVSPGDGDTVSSPRATVRVDASNPNGFGKIIFSWDGRVLKSYENSAEGYVIPVSEEERGTHTLSAELTDALGYVATAQIRVSVDADDSLPQVRFTDPEDGARIEGGSTYRIRVEASDEGGAVKKVEFYANDRRLGADLFPPFEHNWRVPAGNESYTLRAVGIDYADNSGETEISVRVSGDGGDTEAAAPESAPAEDENAPPAADAVSETVSLNEEQDQLPRRKKPR